VTVSVKVPVEAALVVDTFSVEEPEPLTEDGVKLAVPPLGNPLALSDTVLLKPFSAAIETV
jgi:hypothetical protein